MTPSNTGLKEIHDLRVKLEEVTQKLVQGPKQVAAKQATVNAKRTELDAQRLKLKQLKVLSDQKSLQLKSNEVRILDWESKLHACSSNREYEALRTQIAADKMANSVLEDEIIEALEGVDVMAAEIARYEEGVVKQEADLQAFADEVKQQEPGLKQQAEELTAKVGDVESILPPDIVPVYRRLVAAHGAKALAPVKERSCGSCYIGLTSQVVVELKNGKFKFCTCGRLMYFVG
jgi:uncharacterized protein